ncbi:MAG: hypothetical protein WA892_00670 [Ornithinimicrobium sp.]
MDALSQLVVVGEPAQDAGELVDVAGAERGEQLGAVRLRGSAYVCETFSPFRSRMQGVVATVVRVAPSLEQSILLKVVNEGDELAREYSELRGERLL